CHQYRTNPSITYYSDIAQASATSSSLCLSRTCIGKELFSHGLIGDETIPLHTRRSCSGFYSSQNSLITTLAREAFISFP
ncbi:MAG: hypothetical protein RLN96_01100, partial [Pseudomonadales bacterium]